MAIVQAVRRRRSFSTSSVVLGCIALALSSACGADESSSTDNSTASGNQAQDTAHIEIRGTWRSNAGGHEETISDTEWRLPWGTARIISFDNATNTAITQNPDDDAYFPSKYNRNVWTDIQDNAFHYCTIDYGLDSAEEAQAATTPADATDPDNSGCGVGAWTRLTAL